MHPQCVRASCFALLPVLLPPISRRGHLLVVGEFTQGRMKLYRLAVAPDFHLHTSVGCGLGHEPRQVAKAADFIAVERHDHVALLEAGLCSGAVRSNDSNKRSMLALQSQA